MSLSDCMMQSCVSGDICGVQWALVLDQQVDHGHRADGGSPMEGILASFIPDPC